MGAVVAPLKSFVSSHEDLWYNGYECIMLQAPMRYVDIFSHLVYKTKIMSFFAIFVQDVAQKTIASNNYFTMTSFSENCFIEDCEEDSATESNLA